MDKQIGRVKWFSVTRGYGFIGRDDGGDDVFVHHSGIEGFGFKCLEPGTRVYFDIQEGKRGPKAVHVIPS